MHEFPRWKLILLGLVVLAGFLFSLPNLFPQDPAVQVSANRGSVLDESGNVIRDADALASGQRAELRFGRGSRWVRSE